MLFETTISSLITSFSYLGVFISSGLVSAPLWIPLPGYLIILLIVALKLNPILAAIACGIGSTGGDWISYKMGMAGNKIVNRQFKKWKKLTWHIEKYFKKYGFLTIFITAFLIFPFDLVCMMAGASKYSTKKFLLASFLGKFLKTWILIILTMKGIELFFL